MPDTKKLVGKRIKVLRNRSGLTQEQLAELIEMDARHLSRLELGHHFPTLDTLDKIAKELNVPLAQFFEFPDQHSLEAKREYLRTFADQANEEQIDIALKLINLVGI